MPSNLKSETARANGAKSREPDENYNPSVSAGDSDPNPSAATPQSRARQQAVPRQNYQTHGHSNPFSGTSSRPQPEIRNPKSTIPTLQ